MFRTVFLIITLAASAAHSAMAGETLTITSWGGAYEASQRRAYAEPFMQQHEGVEIVWEAKSHNVLAGLRAQVEAEDVVWDLVDLLPDAAQIACDEGLLEPLDHNAMLARGADGSLPSEDFYPGALSNCFVATNVYANVIAYNTELFPAEQPTTIRDLFDLERFPGKRGLERTPLNNLEWALAAGGVPLDEIYATLATDEGVRRALTRLDGIKDSVIWWELGAQPQQLLADKEVVMTAAFNGRIFHAQVNERQPFKIIWDAQVFEFDGWGIPKGKASPRVLEFLRYSTDTQRLADQAKYISYGPARRSSGPLVSTHADTGVEMQPHLPTGKANLSNALPKNIEFWTDNLDELQQVFNAWLNKD